ncbi:hypothetical protein NDU88_007169 [Pleurodeles waltl]|uniref:ASD2 domain-containing protein n=2 Tax=Pleurodeles waltl TaxID=8319 RepID=A0AAV7WFP4_PLEWA|nr:hypothetical protein NDU88_007169 [Pleurodeles waltl]
MVSKESSHSLAQCNIINQDKAMTVRSVLLNRDSPDIESRLKRRRNRTQQVRFKDQVDSTDGDLQKIHSDVLSTKSVLKTQPASTSHAEAERRITPPIAYCSSAGRALSQPSRRHWYQSRPCSLTLPNPKKASMSTAIQTSPSLQKTFPGFRFRSKSVSDFGEEELLVALTNHREKREPAGTNNKHASRCNGETSNSRTLNGGIALATSSFSELNHQPSPHQVLTENKKQPRRRRQSQWQLAPLCSRIQGEVQSQSKAENGTHRKESSSDLASHSPEFHPFYPTNVPSVDCGQIELADLNDDANLSPQWIQRERGEEADMRTKQGSRVKDCDGLSTRSTDPNRKGSHALEPPSTLTKESPSSCSQQNNLPLVMGTVMNCTEPLPSTQTSQDAIPRDTALTQDPQHNSPTTPGLPTPQDHSSVSDHSAVPSPLPVDESPSTPPTRQGITTTHYSPSLAISAANCQQEVTQIPESISATPQQPHLFHVKKDLDHVGQREGEGLSTDSSNSPLSSTSESVQQQELSAGSSPHLHTDVGAPSFSSSGQCHVEDPLEEYYTVRTRDPPPAHAESASESADPEISLVTPAEEPGLTVDQSETLRQVQGLLELVAAAKGRVDLAKEDRDLSSQGRRERAECLRVNRDAGPNRGRQYYKGDVSARLQALEGVLETSQQTIKVLLDVIQDLEKKEAQRDG